MEKRSVPLPVTTILTSNTVEYLIRLKKRRLIYANYVEHLKAPQQLSRFFFPLLFFLSLITGLYVLFIHQLTCHFISYNIMRVLLNSIKWSFNWKAPLHLPIICSKLKADAHSLIRILILFPENQKSLSSCQDILQTQVNFQLPIFFSPSSSSEG